MTSVQLPSNCQIFDVKTHLNRKLYTGGEHRAMEPKALVPHHHVGYGNQSDETEVERHIRSKALPIPSMFPAIPVYIPSWKSSLAAVRHRRFHSHRPRITWEPAGVRIPRGLD